MPRRTNSLFTVMYRHAWICLNADAQTAVTELLDQFCQNEEEQKLITHLLDHFHFADERQRSILLDQVLAESIDRFELSSESTLFLASAADVTTDSSQKFLYDIKTALGTRSWAPVDTLNRFLAKELRNKIAANENLTSIVIVDDFSGTGKTICQRYKCVTQVVAENPRIKVYVMLLVGMAQSAARLKLLGIPHYIGLILRKGITHTLQGIERRKACELMAKIEKRLTADTLVDRFPRFGYGWAQSLYCPVSGGSAGNVPNNVFPIFWWPRTSSGEQRQTLLHRAEGS